LSKVDAEASIVLKLVSPASAKQNKAHSTLISTQLNRLFTTTTQPFDDELTTD
jgi:hypothetical protein